MRHIGTPNDSQLSDGEAFSCIKWLARFGSWQSAFIVAVEAVVTTATLEAGKILPCRTKDRSREKWDFGCCNSGKSKAASLQGSARGCIEGQPRATLPRRCRSAHTRQACLWQRAG